MERRGFVFAVFLILCAAFLINVLGDSALPITGKQIVATTLRSPSVTTGPTVGKIPSIKQCPVFDKVYTENELIAALQKSPSCIDIMNSFPLTKEHSISFKNSYIKCEKGVTLSYGIGPFGINNGFIINQDVDKVTITGCGFSGAFKSAIRNGGKDTRLLDNSFMNNKVGIFETDTARNGIYKDNQITYAYDSGSVLQGMDGKIEGSSITNNHIGVKIGESMIYPPTHPDAICSTNPSYPIYCSLPDWGKRAAIDGNQIISNTIGIDSYALDNVIKNNIITGNNEGVILNAIFAGGEVTYYGYYDEFFQSGATIERNIIDNNNIAGIHLIGRSDSYLWGTINFFRYTKIIRNSMKNNGFGLYIDGKSPSWFDQWDDYLWVEENDISSNTKDGVWTKIGGYNSNFINNIISNNQENGIQIGDTSSTSYWGYYYFLYGNKIKNNGGHGMDVPQGYGYYASLNELSSNQQKGIHVGVAQGQSSSLQYVVCNDISFNNNDGIYAYSNEYPGDLIDFLWLNRIINNAGDGVHYVLPSSSWTPYDKFTPWYAHNQVLVNEISGNANVGFNSDGAFATWFSANNIYNNGYSNVIDTGLNKYNNLWDENDYEKFFNGQRCVCGNTCASNWDCSAHPSYYGSSECKSNICSCPASPPLTCGSDGTCGCYVGAGYYLTYPAPYTPLGNYITSPGLLHIINIQSPPLEGPGTGKTCVTDDDCIFKGCYNGVCADVDQIGATTRFVGYWTPGGKPSDKCANMPSPPSPPAGYCGDGYVDIMSGEECDPPGSFCVKDGQPGVCSADCRCILDDPESPPPRGERDEEQDNNLFLENHPKYKGKGKPPARVAMEKAYEKKLYESLHTVASMNKPALPDR